MIVKYYGKSVNYVARNGNNVSASSISVYNRISGYGSDEIEDAERHKAAPTYCVWIVPGTVNVNESENRMV